MFHPSIEHHHNLGKVWEGLATLWLLPLCHQILFGHPSGGHLAVAGGHQTIVDDRSSDTVDHFSWELLSEYEEIYMTSLSLNAAMNCERREQQTFRAERYLNPIRNSTMIHWSGYNWKRLRLSAVLLAPNRFKSLVIAAQMSLQLNCLVIVPSEIFEHVAWSSLMPWKAWNHIKWNVCYITAAQCVRRHPFSRGAWSSGSAPKAAR